MGSTHGPASASRWWVGLGVSADRFGDGIEGRASVSG